MLVRHKPVAISQITRMYVCSPMFIYHIYYLNKKHFYYYTTAKTELSVYSVYKKNLTYEEIIKDYAVKTVGKSKLF